MSYESLRLLFRGGIRPVGGSFAQSRTFYVVRPQQTLNCSKPRRSRYLRSNCVRKLDVTLDVETKKRLYFVCVRARQLVFL